MKDMLILAVDIGTSSVRSVVLNARGESLASHKIGYRVINPRPDFEEQDPDEIRNQVLDCISRCLDACEEDREKIGGISFSSQMYSIFAVDDEGKPLCNSILWSDGRAEEDAAALKDRYGNRLYDLTGCPMSSIYPIAKIAWIKREMPEIFAKAAEFLSIKEYVLRCLSDQRIVDFSMASATGLFDIRRHSWSPEAMDAVGLDEGRLSRPVSGTVKLAIDNKGLLAEWGLSEQIGLYPGGGDGPLANLGAGAGRPGEMNIDLGTSGAARIVCDRPLTSPKGELWCYCLTDSIWTCGGILSNVGNALVWLVENLLTDKPGILESGRVTSGCSAMEQLASQVDVGTEGLFFLPYLRRARSPYWEPSLSGNLFGMKAHHDSRHIVRAMLEAIGYDLKSIVDILESMGESVKRIILSGGLCQGPYIPGILCDVLGSRIFLGESTEASLRGAGILGLYGMGCLDDLGFVDAHEESRRALEPDKESSKKYKELHMVYQKLIDIVVHQIEPVLGGQR